MPVKIEFATDNAAFADAGYSEVAAILRGIAEKCEDSFAFKSGKIRDANSNTIGAWEATVDAEDAKGEDIRPFLPKDRRLTLP